MFSLVVHIYVVIEAWLWSKGTSLCEMVKTLQIRDKIISYARQTVNTRYGPEILCDNTFFLVVNSKVT